MRAARLQPLGQLPAAEAADLVTRTEGRLCVRLYRRRDGTVLTADCPDGVARRRRGRLYRVASAVALGFSSLTGLGLVVRARRDNPSLAPPPPHAWIDWLWTTFGFAPAPPVAQWGVRLPILDPIPGEFAAPGSAPAGHESAGYLEMLEKWSSSPEAEASMSARRPLDTLLQRMRPSPQKAALPDPPRADFGAEDADPHGERRSRPRPPDDPCGNFAADLSDPRESASKSSE